MDINEEILARAVAYANTRAECAPLSDDMDTAKEALEENIPQRVWEDWPWGCFVRAYYDGAQSVYDEMESTIDNLCNSTIPPAPSQEFDLEIHSRKTVVP